MPVSEEQVRAAYLMILGREPENDRVVAEKLHYPDLAALGENLVSSDEFCARYGKSAPREQRSEARYDASKWVATDVLGRYVQWVDLHDAHVSRGCLDDNWEASETAYFTARLSPGDTVLDVGANVGWFSLVAAKHIGPAGQIHAFEPRPETARALKRTIADNRLQSVIHLWPYALSDHAAELNLIWAPNTDNPGGSSLTTAAPSDTGHDSARVLALRLDDLLPEIAPDVVKIDVEGAEPQAMRGMVNTLSRKHPPILSELHAPQLKAVSNSTPRAYIDQMGALGYACYRLEDGQPRERLHDLPDGHGDLISVVFEWRAGL